MSHNIFTTQKKTNEWRGERSLYWPDTLFCFELYLSDSKMTPTIFTQGSLCGSKAGMAPTTHHQVHQLALGHFKNTEVLIFGAALVFSHYLVHLMPIGTILSKIDQYLDLPHRLWSFRVNMGGSKIQNVKIITNGALRYAKWWENSKSGFKIQIG